MKTGKMWFISIIILLTLMILGMRMQGCKFKIIPEEQERREIEFVIVSEECIPEAVKTIIESGKEKEMKLTYIDGKERYIIMLQKMHCM